MICECTKTWQQNQEGSPVLTFEIDCQDLHFLEKNVKNNTYGEFFFLNLHFFGGKIGKKCTFFVWIESK